MAAEAPVILDVSRLVSRIGTGPLTGIDRVEAAWLGHVASRKHNLICRVSRGQLLLPPEAGPKILRWISGNRWDLPVQPGWRERLAGQNGGAARAKTALREMALFSAGRSGKGLVRQAMQSLGRDITYLNVGHSNLDRAFLANMSECKRVVMIHDTIPLDHPEYTREGQTKKFRTRFMTALTFADQIIAISQATAERIELWRGRLAITRRAPIAVAHIGTTLSPSRPDEIPGDLDLRRPFFLALGTIEPRKNHALLLDAWDIIRDRMSGEDIPQLFIIGRRGWNNHEVFARLDALPLDGPVKERNHLNDGAVAALVERCHGLLMPSFAEGFGLPLTEAAARGVPLLCTPLPSARELIGDYATYLPASNPDEWAGKIIELANINPIRMKKLEISGWENHFRIVNHALEFAPQGRGA
ncbi:glycosyltransferase family 4 protein [Paracoccus albus]|uniref:glycosyltransferase family 4 protein n=1 Tax=Paracoccus albus TaxID=3017784 RepID=UPI0022F120AA|nr:glycosyltransferase family 1 protein [Paracoccus albus]WBU60219.1 glycosyltransferase family 1 protein [Paracoccus albus]